MRVYSIKSPSGKQYIGITKHTVEHRFKQHKARAAKRTTRHPLYDAMRKYGPDTFAVEELASGLTVEEAKDIEVTFIELYSAQNSRFGYNVSAGGDYDAGTGGKVFWASLEEDPERRATYLAKLSESMKARVDHDWEGMRAAQRAWREANPEKARDICAANGAKGIEKLREMWAAGWRPARVALTDEQRARMSRSQILRNLLRTEEQVQVKREQTRRTVTAVWAGRSEEEIRAVGDKIAESSKRKFQNMTTEERAAHDAQLAEARKNIDHDKRKARQREALAAYWTPERKAAKSAAMKARRAAEKAAK